MEKAGRAAAQRDRDRRAPRLYRGAAQPPDGRGEARLPGPPGIREDDDVALDLVASVSPVRTSSRPQEQGYGYDDAEGTRASGGAAMIMPGFFASKQKPPSPRTRREPRKPASAINSNSPLSDCPE